MDPSPKFLDFVGTVTKSRFMPRENTASKVVVGKIKNSSTTDQSRHVRRCEITEANRVISITRTYQFYSIAKASSDVLRVSRVSSAGRKLGRHRKSLALSETRESRCE